MSNCMDQVTYLPDADAFAEAFREGTLLCAFEELHLNGPEGSFKASGLLYRDESNIVLEFVPIPADGSSIPPRRQCRGESPSDCWNGSGVTIDGVMVELRSMYGFGGNYSEHGVPRRKRFRQEVEKVVVAPGEDRPSKRKEFDTSIYAKVAETDLQFTNAGVETVTIRDFRGQSTKKWDLDSLVGRTASFEFAVRRESKDLAIEMHSLEDKPTQSHEEEREKFDALLDGMAILLGQNMRPWRLRHRRSSGFNQEELRPVFSHKTGAMRPFHQSRRDADEPARFLALSIDYFSAGSETCDQLSKYLS